MKTYFFGLIVISALSTSPVLANDLFVDTGPGTFYSADTFSVFVRYQRDTSKLFNRESYYEAFFANWNGHNYAYAIGIARGIRLFQHDDRYFSFTFGGCHISRETNNLGTPFQFYIRLSYDVKVYRHDLSLGYVHISNGKFIFGWDGPNNGENFITLGIGFF